MSFYQRLKETLARGEAKDNAFMLDRTAFTLATAHRAELLDGEEMVRSHPKLKAQFEDCLKQNSAPINRFSALLQISRDIDNEDTNGYVSDLIRKINQ